MAALRQFQTFSGLEWLPHNQTLCGSDECLLFRIAHIAAEAAELSHIGCGAGNLRRSGGLGHVPRYFFHLLDDLATVDEEGLELPNLAAARAGAENFARSMAAASVLDMGKINLDHRIEVTNEAGEDVLTVRFGDVISIQG